MNGPGGIGKSEANGLHSNILLSSDAEARAHPTGDQLNALIPALCPRRTLKSLKGVLGVGESGTAYILILASAEPVARRDPSGENLTEVIPRACAFGIENS